MRSHHQWELSQVFLIVPYLFPTKAAEKATMIFDFCALLSISNGSQSPFFDRYIYKNVCVQFSVYMVRGASSPREGPRRVKFGSPFHAGTPMPSKTNQVAYTVPQWSFNRTGLKESRPKLVAPLRSKEKIVWHILSVKQVVKWLNFGTGAWLATIER